MSNERCGAWGGCTLPAAHNMGRADIPENHQPPATAQVTLFKASGKYYTCEEWRIPTQEQIDEAAGRPKADYPFLPSSMRYSPDFRRIGGGAVLVDTQEPWGYPHLIPGESA